MGLALWRAATGRFRGVSATHDLTACVLIPRPWAGAERCDTLPVPSVLDARCFGEVNSAPRSTWEEPIVTRTTLQQWSEGAGSEPRNGRNPGSRTVSKHQLDRRVQLVKAIRCVELGHAL